MTISLDYILKRNKSDLKTFIRKNKLTSYELLLEYCETRKFIPCSEAEYNKIIGKEVVQNEQRKVSRKVSKAPGPKKRRYRRKKQQDTPKLPDSPDKG